MVWKPGPTFTVTLLALSMIATAAPAPDVDPQEIEMGMHGARAGQPQRQRWEDVAPAHFPEKEPWKSQEPQSLREDTKPQEKMPNPDPVDGKTKLKGKAGRRGGGCVYM